MTDAQELTAPRPLVEIAAEALAALTPVEIREFAPVIERIYRQRGLSLPGTLKEQLSQKTVEWLLCRDYEPHLIQLPAWLNNINNCAVRLQAVTNELADISGSAFWRESTNDGWRNMQASGGACTCQPRRTATMEPFPSPSNQEPRRWAGQAHHSGRYANITAAGAGTRVSLRLPQHPCSQHLCR